MEVSGKRSDFTEEGTADELKKDCELCEAENVTTIANGICRECQEYMCNTCFRHHLKGKLYRQHVLVDSDKPVTPVQRSAENVEKCKRHSNETIKYYCRKHETVGCGDCMIPGHVACQPECIKDLSKGFQQNDDFKILMRKLETIMSANKENDKKRQVSQKANTNMLEKALKGIETFRSDINNYLDRAAASIIKEAKDIERDNDKLLAKLEHDCTQLSSRITDMRQKLDAEMYQESALFIQTIDCKPRIIDMEREVSRIESETNIRTFDFIPDKQLQDIITSIEKLGSLGKNKGKSSMKPDATGLPNEEDKEAFTGHLEQTVPVEEKKGKGIEQAKQTYVGARVRPIGEFARIKYWVHRGQPGTVTAVNSDCTVNVSWDGTGWTRNGYSIGVNVELI